jgi:hypothetical protein
LGASETPLLRHAFYLQHFAIRRSRTPCIAPPKPCQSSDYRQSTTRRWAGSAGATKAGGAVEQITRHRQGSPRPPPNTLSDATWRKTAAS